MKQPFTLEEWYKSKGRKVVTKEGVEIHLSSYNFDTGFIVSAAGNSYRENELFFEDPEPKSEKLTEFERAVKSLMIRAISYENEKVREEAKELLDIARKEIEACCWFTRGQIEKLRQAAHDDALNQMPRLKKVNPGLSEHLRPSVEITLNEECDIVVDGYAISRSELLKLPKEE